MYGGGYVFINWGVGLFTGGGIRNNKLFNKLEYARVHNKPVLMRMCQVDEFGGHALDSVTSFISYTYYEHGFSKHKYPAEKDEPVYILCNTFCDERSEIHTRYYWVKKEEE